MMIDLNKISSSTNSVRYPENSLSKEDAAVKWFENLTQEVQLLVMRGFQNYNAYQGIKFDKTTGKYSVLFGTKNADQAEKAKKEIQQIFKTKKITKINQNPAQVFMQDPLTPEEKKKQEEDLKKLIIGQLLEGKPQDFQESIQKYLKTQNLRQCIELCNIIAEVDWKDIRYLSDDERKDVFAAARFLPSQIIENYNYLDWTTVKKNIPKWQALSDGLKQIEFKGSDIIRETEIFLKNYPNTEDKQIEEIKEDVVQIKDLNSKISTFKDSVSKIDTNFIRETIQDIQTKWPAIEAKKQKFIEDREKKKGEFIEEEKTKSKEFQDALANNRNGQESDEEKKKLEQTIKDNFNVAQKQRDEEYKSKIAEIEKNFYTEVDASYNIIKTQLQSIDKIAQESNLDEFKELTQEWKNEIQDRERKQNSYYIAGYSVIQAREIEKYLYNIEKRIFEIKIEEELSQKKTALKEKLKSVQLSLQANNKFLEQNPKEIAKSIATGVKTEEIKKALKEALDVETDEQTVAMLQLMYALVINGPHSSIVIYKFYRLFREYENQIKNNPVALKLYEAFEVTVKNPEQFLNKVKDVYGKGFIEGVKKEGILNQSLTSFLEKQELELDGYKLVDIIQAIQKIVENKSVNQKTLTTEIEKLLISKGCTKEYAKYLAPTFAESISISKQTKTSAKGLIFFIAGLILISISVSLIIVAYKAEIDTAINGESNTAESNTAEQSGGSGSAITNPNNQSDIADYNNGFKIKGGESDGSAELAATDTSSNISSTEIDKNGNPVETSNNESSESPLLTTEIAAGAAGAAGVLSTVAGAVLLKKGTNPKTSLSKKEVDYKETYKNSNLKRSSIIQELKSYVKEIQKQYPNLDSQTTIQAAKLISLILKNPSSGITIVEPFLIEKAVTAIKELQINNIKITQDVLSKITDLCYWEKHTDHNTFVNYLKNLLIALKEGIEIEKYQDGKKYVVIESKGENAILVYTTDPKNCFITKDPNIAQKHSLKNMSPEQVITVLTQYEFGKFCDSNGLPKTDLDKQNARVSIVNAINKRLFTDNSKSSQFARVISSGTEVDKIIQETITEQLKSCTIIEIKKETLKGLEQRLQELKGKDESNMSAEEAKELGDLEKTIPEQQKTLMTFEKEREIVRTNSAPPYNADPEQFVNFLRKPLALYQKQNEDKEIQQVQTIIQVYDKDITTEKARPIYTIKGKKTTDTISPSVIKTVKQTNGRSNWYHY